MDPITIATAILIGTFALLAAVDGIYLHIWRYRLHDQPDARNEHALHSAHALVFPLLVWSLFLADGAPGWLAWASIAATLGLVAWDAAIETRSRHFQGGLPAGEAALHSALHGLHVAAVALGVTAAYADTSPSPSALTWVAGQILPGSIVVALAHVALWARPGLLPRRTGPSHYEPLLVNGAP